MIKKIFWTIILVSPLIIYGSLFINNSGEGVFNSNNAFDSWVEFFKKISWMSKEDNSGGWINLILLLIMAFFWTAPFWYAWKGTFIVDFVPRVGFILRVSLLAILFLIPVLFSPFDNNFIDQITLFASIGIVIISLLGLWIKS